MRLADLGDCLANRTGKTTFTWCRAGANHQQTREPRADRDRWVARVKDLEAQLQRVREVVR